MSDRVERARARAADTIGRLRSALEGGFAVTLSVEEAGEVLDLLKALDQAIPSVGPDSDLEARCDACKGQGCDECEGVGMVMTSAGRKLWDFITRRISISAD